MDSGERERERGREEAGLTSVIKIHGRGMIAEIEDTFEIKSLRICYTETVNGDLPRIFNGFSSGFLLFDASLRGSKLRAPLRRRAATMVRLTGVAFASRNPLPTPPAPAAERVCLRS